MNLLIEDVELCLVPVLRRFKVRTIHYSWSISAVHWSRFVNSSPALLHRR